MADGLDIRQIMDIRGQATGEMLRGNYEGAAAVLKTIPSNQRAYKEVSMLGASYFYTGRFWESYQAFRQLMASWPDYQPEAKIVLMHLESDPKFLIDLPIPTDYSQPQSIDGGNDDYEDCQDIYAILRLPDGQREARLRDIQGKAASKDLQTKAVANFQLAEYAFAQGDKPLAFQRYLDAIRANPNKALYWGYAAQALFQINHAADTLAEGAFGISRLVHTAISLDPKNPKWHLYQSMVLFWIAFFVHNLLKHQAILEAQRAYSLCRFDQDSIRRDVSNHIKGMEDTFSKNLPGDIAAGMSRQSGDLSRLEFFAETPVASRRRH